MSWEWLAYIGIGIATGLMSGFFGVGGGVVLVPLLVYFMGFSQQSAQGTSLALLSVPVVLLAATKYYQNGWVQLPVVGWIIIGFLVGSYFGAAAVARMDGGVLQRCFGLAMLYIGFEFTLSDKRFSRALLPAAVAAAAAFLFTIVLRRARKPRPTPSEPEYHI